MLYLILLTSILQVVTKFDYYWFFGTLINVGHTLIINFINFYEIIKKLSKKLITFLFFYNFFFINRLQFQLDWVSIDFLGGEEKNPKLIYIFFLKKKEKVSFYKFETFYTNLEP